MVVDTGGQPVASWGVLHARGGRHCSHRRGDSPCLRARLLATCGHTRSWACSGEGRVSAALKRTLRFARGTRGPRSLSLVLEVREPMRPPRLEPAVATCLDV